MSVLYTLGNEIHVPSLEQIEQRDVLDTCVIASAPPPPERFVYATFYAPSNFSVRGFVASTDTPEFYIDPLSFDWVIYPFENPEFLEYGGVNQAVIDWSDASWNPLRLENMFVPLYLGSMQPDYIDVEIWFAVNGLSSGSVTITLPDYGIARSYVVGVDPETQVNEPDVDMNVAYENYTKYFVELPSLIGAGGTYVPLFVNWSYLNIRPVVSRLYCTVQASIQVNFYKNVE